MERGIKADVTERKVTPCRFIGEHRMGKTLGVPHDSRSELELIEGRKVIRLTGDSGCTTTMTYKREALFNYVESKPKTHFIETADGTQCEVVGYGKIQGEAKNTDGEMIDVCVKTVYHVKELRETLLSINTATKKNGCTYVQSPDQTYIQVPKGDKLPFVDDERGLEELVGARECRTLTGSNLRKTK